VNSRNGSEKENEERIGWKEEAKKKYEDLSGRMEWK
jgi:hypothetical protein